MDHPLDIRISTNVVFVKDQLQLITLCSWFYVHALYLFVYCLIEPTAYVEDLLCKNYILFFLVSISSAQRGVFSVMCNWVVSIHCCWVDPSSTFRSPSVTTPCLTPPHIAQCTPSPAPRSKCWDRIQPWASKEAGPKTSGTSHDPSGWRCGAADGTRTAAEPGLGLYQTCQCSGNTWCKKGLAVNYMKRMHCSENEQLVLYEYLKVTVGSIFL